MRFYQRLAVFAFLSLLFTRSFAQPTVYPPYGCKATSNNVVYYDWLGTSDGGKYVFKGYPTYSIAPYTWNSSAMAAYPCYRWIVDENPQGCKIKTSSSSNTYIAGQRGYFLQSTTYCPLDDYIILLFIPLMVLGWCYIRGANLAQKSSLL